MIRLLLLIMFAFGSVSAAQDDVPNTDYRVEAFVNNASPYVGEQILYGFRYYAYASQTDLIQQLPNFEGFWLADVYELTDERVETLNGLQYVVGELFAEIMPIQPGLTVIEPAVLEVPDTVFQQGGIFLTERIEVEVIPLPEGALPEFKGAVGQFNALFTLEPNRITLGQPVTLTMTIDGSSNLERLPAPPLPDSPLWRVYPNPSRYEVSALGSLRFGQKIFEWLLLPEQTGSQVFPAVVFSYFDPQADEYRSIASSPFTVEVFPGADNLRTLPSYDPAVPGETQVLPLKPVLENVEQDGTRLNLISALLWIMPAVFMITSGLLVYGKQVISHRQKRNKKEKALQKAIDSLQSAPTSSTIYQHILNSISTYLNDKSGTEIILKEDLRGTLAAYNIDQTLQEQLIEHVKRIDSARFVPGGTENELHLQEIIATLKLIEESWH